MDHLDFKYIDNQFRLCKRDAYSVWNWLTGDKISGGKGIDQTIALEVMLEFADRIREGERFGFNKLNLSELSLAVLKECQERQKMFQGIMATRMLKILKDDALIEDEFADNIYGMLGMIYEKVDKEDRKRREKRGKKSNSILRQPMREVWRRTKNKMRRGSK